MAFCSIDLQFQSWWIFQSGSGNAGLLLLTLGAVRKKFWNCLSGYKCILVCYLQNNEAIRIGADITAVLQCLTEMRKELFCPSITGSINVWGGTNGVTFLLVARRHPILILKLKGFANSIVCDCKNPFNFFRVNGQPFFSENIMASLVMLNKVHFYVPICTQSQSKNGFWD